MLKLHTFFTYNNMYNRRVMHDKLHFFKKQLAYLTTF